LFVRKGKTCKKSIRVAIVNGVKIFLLQMNMFVAMQTVIIQIVHLIIRTKIHVINGREKMDEKRNHGGDR